MAGIKHVRPHERFTGVVQSGSMSREAGVSPETTGSTAIWSGWVTTPAGSVSDVHHHGDCETAIYILKGRARFRFGEKLEYAIEVGAGDFLFVPPFEIHQEENLSDTEPVELIVSRGCTGILTVNVPDPRTHDHGASHSQ
jgi:uncharacterized RmlC-like cupin family protein